MVFCADGILQIFTLRTVKVTVESSDGHDTLTNCRIIRWTRYIGLYIEHYCGSSGGLGDTSELGREGKEPLQ